MVWKIIVQGGKKKRGRRGEAEAREEEEGDEVGDLLNASAKADKYRLVRWEERVGDEHLGEIRGNQPAPLIDKLHRLMHLLRQNRGNDVQAAYDAWGLKGDPAFPRLLQAIRELALEGHQAEERRLIESLASQLKMNRSVVVEDGKVRETPLFEYGIVPDEETSWPSPNRLS